MKSTLFTIIIIFCIQFNRINAQNYSVESLTFDSFIANTILNPLSTSDDMHSNIIPIGFNFNLMDSTFNRIVVSTNGYINFDLFNANNYSAWYFNQSIPNASFPVKNAILGCYQDLYNSNGTGNIIYGQYGTQPYRKFVVWFDNNPLFSCNNLTSSFQMVLHETTNYIDVNLISVETCPTWNGGRAVVGLIDATGNYAITPPGRNTGMFTAASNEKWRFKNVNYVGANALNYYVCDAGNDGFETFDLSYIQNIIDGSNPVAFYLNADDAQSQINSIGTTSFTNTIDSLQKIYTNYNSSVFEINLTTVNCDNDSDFDGVLNNTEDINNDRNLGNDDTDNDGIPNFLDNDDDNDFVLTSVEYVFRARYGRVTLLDSDTDGIPNYLDNDDDGDGILTYLEDTNFDGDPVNDDINNNNIPDYIDSELTSGINVVDLNKEFKISPNPAKDFLMIRNEHNHNIEQIEILSLKGELIKNIREKNVQYIDIKDLSSAMYILKIQSNDAIYTGKFIKN